MRRKDREITDPVELDKIIADCDCCRLGFTDGGGCYIVPLNFGYRRGNAPVFYFHSAREGRKVELARRGGVAGFELDCGHGLLKGAEACRCSFAYRSVIGQGEIALVDDPAEKRAGMALIMDHMAGSGTWGELPAGAEDKIAILRLTVAWMTGKAHIG